MKLSKTAIHTLVIAVAFSFAAVTAHAMGSSPPKAENIIFMVPDGMGLADVTAARIFKNGPGGDRLSFETMPVIGYQRTHSMNSTVTDSAAAASAWASGEKYNNGEISCHDNDTDGRCDGEPVPTILDVARSMGKAAGLVATSDITHATPAAFGANVHNRKCEAEIARQFLTRHIDVLLGAGIAANRSTCLLPPSGRGWLEALLEEYKAAGYTVVDTKAAMDTAAADGRRKMLGLFKPGGKTQETFRVDPARAYPETEPTLPQMTRAALALLETRENGFFLMVEGSQIDWADHAHNVKAQIAETLAFAEAVQVVLDWIEERPRRRRHTLVVVVADHETGGFAINGPYGTLSQKGDIIREAWTSGQHTAVDTLIWAQGPTSEKFGRALDNTDLYDLMSKALK